MDEKDKVVNKLLGKVLKIERKRFIEFFYDDRDSLLELAEDVIDGLSYDGKYEKDIDDIWIQCGFIHKDLVLNPEVAEWNEDDEIEEAYQDYQVEWV